MASIRHWRARLLLAMTPVFLLVIAELVVRWFVPPPPTPPAPPIFVELNDAQGAPLTAADGQRLWSNHAEARHWAVETGRDRFWFTARKAPGSLRVFTLGASTTFGAGLDARISFARFLELRLRRLTGREVEVINTGVSGYDSSQLPQVARELTAFEPDLFVLYAGHNELKYPNLSRVRLGPRWLRWVRRSALARLVMGAREAEATIPTREELASLLPDPYSEQPFLDEEEWTHAQAMFRAALESIADSAESAQVPVVACVPASNLADHGPRLTVWESDRASEFQQTLEDLRPIWDDGPLPQEPPTDLSDATNPDAAGEDWRFWASRNRGLVDEVLREEPAAARAHYLRGRILLALGHARDALESFRDAVSHDGLPERASPQFQEIVRSVGRERGWRAVDVEARFVAESSRGVAGFDLFFDYCHPTDFGHWLITDELIHVLLGEQLLVPLEVIDVDAEAGLVDASEFPDQGQYLRRRFEVDCAELGIELGQSVGKLIEKAQLFVGAAIGTRDPRVMEQKLAAAEEALTAARRMDADHVQAALLNAVVAALRGDPDRCRSSLQRASQTDSAAVVGFAKKIAVQVALVAAFGDVGVTVDPTGGFSWDGGAAGDRP